MSVGGAGVYLLDYGAGNVLSVANAVKAVGGELKLITEAADFDKVRRVCVGRARNMSHSVCKKGFFSVLFFAHGVMVVRRPYLMV